MLGHLPSAESVLLLLLLPLCFDCLCYTAFKTLAKVLKLTSALVWDMIKHWNCVRIKNKIVLMATFLCCFSILSVWQIVGHSASLGLKTVDFGLFCVKLSLSFIPLFVTAGIKACIHVYEHVCKGMLWCIYNIYFILKYKINKTFFGTVFETFVLDIIIKLHG